MSSRRLPRLAVAGAALVAGLAIATPAAAAVTYDPGTLTGFVDGADVRDAFGWTDAMLDEHAAEVSFTHDFWIDDTYAAACGQETVPVVHQREAGHHELTATVARDRTRGALTGYGSGPTGFRITGAWAGISAASPPPAVGDPCLQDLAPGSTVDRVDPVSSVTGWALVVSFGDDRRELLAEETPAPLP